MLNILLTIELSLTVPFGSVNDLRRLQLDVCTVIWPEVSSNFTLKITTHFHLVTRTYRGR
jgi:hypothetical protein